MQVGLLEGRFLQMLVRLTGARNILEIGMFTGYSTLMMAEALPEDGRLITCEVDLKAEAMARKYFGESPHGHKITIRMGPALETIKALSGPLDMVFIDADKPNYSNYYHACFPLVKPGGLIIGDNVFWSGKVIDPQDDDTRAIVAFNQLVQSDPRVENICLTVRDGMMLAWKPK
jgi:predicted O-methyltransferase YrrM